MRILFPQPIIVDGKQYETPDAKFARVIKDDSGQFIVQSEYNNETLEYDDEYPINMKEPLPKIRAVIVYTGTLCEAICRRLRKRKAYTDYWNEEKEKQMEREAECGELNALAISAEKK